MIFSHDYDTNYDPAAPVLSIGIGSIDREGQAQVIALVDSGSDVTMIPLAILRQVKARYVESRNLRGVTGHRIRVKRYSVIIQVGGETIYGVRAVATTTGDEVILGRDVLNQLVVTLNGLAHIVEVSV
jgi:hypothetical protein